MIIALWMLALAVGFGILMDHDLRSGQLVTTRNHWPAASSLARAQSGATLVMFIHPECPCTRASLEQLAEIVGHDATPSTKTYILVADVSGGGGDNLEIAQQIHGATVHIDRAGAEAAKFASHTSGELFVFAADGRLAFQGGITAARGHAGENAAAAAAREAVSGTSTGLVQMPVFGCALASKELAAGE